MSLRARLILSGTLLILCTCLILGGVASWFATRTVEREALRAVGIAADGRKLALDERLGGVVQRNALFLNQVRRECAADEACAALRLADHVALVHIRAARLELTGLPPLRAGEQGAEIDGALASIPVMDAGQLALTVALEGRPTLGVRIDAANGDRITLLPDMKPVYRIFADRAGLGDAGETFLTDAQGFFLTPARYPNGAGHSHPIAARPMDACLAGRAGEIIDPDYRDVVVVHGFRPIPEIGGGCIMAHIDRDEAYAPVRGLLARLAAATLGIGLLSAVIAGRGAAALTRPVDLLTERARAYAEGDHESPFPVGGTPEVAELGRTFSRLVAHLADTIERLSESNRDLETFNHSVAHDLRAPLRTVSGCVRSVLDEHAATLPPDAVRSLARARDEADRLSRLVNHLLALSRAASKPLEKTNVPPAEVVRAVVAELRAEAPERHVEVTVGELPDCSADPSLLTQLYTNLIGNAFKFTSGRDPAVIEIGWADGAYFVRDNGVGFDMKYIDRVFDVFQRLHGADEFEGTGLGLPIARRIVERHGGRIWAEAQVGRGATFHFTLAA